MTKKNVLKIDGNTGEGGGQIIRTALALSMLTGTPIELTNIRAGRTKPGLMRQHLMCVQASKLISDAKVSGAYLGSTALSFTPNEVASGDYDFDIGSAGSTHLVLQTLLPALLFSGGSASSTLTIKGGTHNPMAPTADFLTYAFIPSLAKFGMNVDYELIKTGYAPIGGGAINVTVVPYTPNRCHPDRLPFNLMTRGDLVSVELVASHLNLDNEICQRELTFAKERLIKAGVDATLIKTKVIRQSGIGEGNSCYAIVTHTIIPPTNIELKKEDFAHTHQEVFTLLGEKRTSAEKVANRLAGLVKRYLFKTEALVDEYLTDQLLLPLALSGGGTFTARTLSQHSKTQAWMIEQFLPVSIEFDTRDDTLSVVKVIC